MPNTRFLTGGLLGAQLNEQYTTAESPHRVLTKANTDNGTEAIYVVVDADSSGAAICSVAADGTAVTTTSVVVGYVLGPSVSVSAGNYCWAVRTSINT